MLNRDLASADLEWSFTENGGHSLAAIALSAALRRRGITISSQTILISRKLSDITRGLDPNPPAPQPLIETETSSSHASPLSSPVALSDDSTDQSSQSISVSGELKSAEPASTHQTGKVSWLARTFPNTVDDKASNNHVHFLSDQVPPSQPPAATEARPSQPGYFDVVPQATETTTGTTVAAQNDEQAATETIAHAPGPRHETARSSTTGAESRRDSVTTDTQMNPSIITEMQLSMIHGSLKYPGTNIVHYLETYATEYLPLMRMAWEKVIGMEPIFRTRFPEQLVGTHQPRFVWDRATAESKEDYNYLVDEACQSTIIGSHFRVVTWQPPGERSRSTIVWSVHHALIDGYSAVQVFQKVRQVVTGVEPVAGPSFEDLAAELKEFQDTNKDHGDAFWKEEKDVFADAKGDLNLPLPMDCADGCRCEHDEVALPLHNDYDRACKIVQTYGATPAALLHAAWALALSIYSDSDAVVFGSVVSGRSLPLTNMEEAIGPMVNTLPFCIRLDKEQSAQSFVRSVFEKIVKLSEFGWTTLDNGYSRQFESALASKCSHPRNDVCATC